MMSCCLAGVDQQSDALIEGACERQTTITFEENQCTVTEDFVDDIGAVVSSATRDEGNDHCCQAYTENGNENLLDACEMI
jgi:hypothetical protein